MDARGGLVQVPLRVSSFIGVLLIGIIYQSDYSTDDKVDYPDSRCHGDRNHTANGARYNDDLVSNG